MIQRPLFRRPLLRRPLLRRVAPLAMAAALAAALPLAAMAAEHQDQSDAAVMNAAKVSLAQAIATAEQQTGGKAFDAGVDNENGTARISVQVAGSQGVRTVLIDPATGAVIASRAGGDEGGQGEHED